MGKLLANMALLVLMVTFVVPLSNGLTYLNDTNENTTSSSIMHLLNINLTIYDGVNHIFQGKSTTNTADWDFSYVSSNSSGFLLRIRVTDVGGVGDPTNDKLEYLDCVDLTKSPYPICGPNCAGVDFGQYQTYNLTFYYSNLTANINVGGQDFGAVPLCSNATQMDRINFSRTSALGTFSVKNNIITGTPPSPPDTTPPIINGSLNATSGYNSIRINDIINITYNITDETGLSYANITWNFTNNIQKINFTGLSGTSAQINNVTQIPCGVGCVINITGYATDTSGNVNQNSTLFTVADSLGTIQLGFNLSSVLVNNQINVSGNVSDADGNIAFGWITYNQTGNPAVNYTFQGGGNNFNFSQAIAITNTKGNVINFTVYYNDTLGTIVQNSGVFTVLDSVGFIRTGINNTSPKINDWINISGNATDVDGNFAFGIVSLNVSGNPQLNFSFDLTSSGINGNFSKAFQINLTKGNQINFTVMYNDTNGTIVQNSTLINVLNSPPTQSTPVITSNDYQNRKNGTLTCNNQSTADLDNDAVTNFIKWFNNSMLINSSVNSATLNVGNYSKTDNLTCEITPFDGTVNGTAFNSTNFTILNAAPLLNNSIANKAWDKDTSTTISLVNGFVDIDNDNLTYNYSDVSSITISINNQTGTATLNPSSGFTGTRIVIFYAFDGTNLTNSTNITLTVNEVTAPSSSSSSSGSSGGGGGGNGYVCNLNWKCDGWSSCENEEQTRKCVLVEVPVFTLNQKCPQDTIPEQSRSCAAPEIKKGTCSDGIKNQDEEGIDCGGVCKPCKKPTIENNTTQNSNSITGAVVGNPSKFSMNTVWLVFAFVLMLLSILFYGKYSHKRLFRKEKLSEEEIKKLNEMLSYSMFKK